MVVSSTGSHVGSGGADGTLFGQHAVEVRSDRRAERNPRARTAGAEVLRDAGCEELGVVAFDIDGAVSYPPTPEPPDGFVRGALFHRCRLDSVPLAFGLAALFGAV